MKQRLRLLAQECYPAQCAQLRNAARRVLDNTFLFDAPWDMEQTCVPVHFDGQIDWELIPAGDPEWTYMLARHSFVFQLAQVYALDGGPEYFEKAEALILDFIQNAPLTQVSRQTVWRSLDAAIRISSWLDALELFTREGADTAQLEETLRGQARLYADYLLGVDTQFCRLSNWGVIGNAGLYQAARFLGDEAAAREALRRICDELTLQILPDGWHWEQSPMYHVEVLLALLRVLRLSGEADGTQKLRAAAQRMALAIAASKKPDHRQFMQGDSDDTDLRDVITQCALALGSAQLKAHGFAQPDLESLIFGNTAQLEAYRTLPAQPLDENAAFADSGSFYLRTGWGETDGCVHFRCGPLGSGHGHADLLHIDLCAFGQDVLIDTGRYTYVEGAPRLWYKSPAAHNTFTVDELPFTECVSTWGYGRIAAPGPARMYMADGMYMVEGGHLGYAFLSDPVYCRRMVLPLANGVCFLLDIAVTRGTHSYQQYFHLPDSGCLCVSEGEAVHDGAVKTRFLFPDRSGEVTAQSCSRHYNQQSPSDCLTLRCECSGLCVMPTAIVSLPERLPEASLTELSVCSAKSGERLSASSARAYRLCAEGQEWTLAFSIGDAAQENDMLAAGDVLAHGRVIAAHNGVQHILVW